MTTKQIAEAAGRDERTIRRWVDKLSDKMSVIADKMTASSPMKPADYDFEETIAIIEHGMGKNAAAIYRQNAEQGNPTENLEVRIDRLEQFLEKQMVLIGNMVMLLQTRQEQPKQLPTPKPLSQRDELRMIVNSSVHNGNYKKAWNELYSHYYYRYGRNLQACAEHRGMAILEFAEHEGILLQLIALAKEIF